MAGATIHIKVDDHEAQELFRNLRRRMSDMRPFFQVAGEIIVDSVHRAFEQGRSPEGEPWPPRRGDPAGRPSGYKTMIRSGRLMRSMTAHASSHQVEVGTNVVYAAIHQFGGTTKPHEIRPRRKQALAFTSGGENVVVKSVHHPGSRIPARPFLGIDEQAWAEIIKEGEHFLEQAAG
jgi:phage virion morphogenesis protein